MKPLYPVGGIKLVQQLWKSVRRLLKTLKVKLPYDLAIPFLSIYLKKCKSTYEKDTWACVVAQEVESLLSKHEALSSNRERERRTEREREREREKLHTHVYSITICNNQDMEPT
jgi:hypothetical protein